MKMSKYSHEVRQQAISMIETNGVNKTSEMMHIAKLTLSRWRKEASVETSVELDATKKMDIQSVASTKKPAQVTVDEKTSKPAAPTLDAPINKPIREDTLKTAKQLLFEDSKEEAARIQSLEAENAHLRSEAKQLCAKCERFRDALAALIR
jgi:hypothetical protein